MISGWKKAWVVVGVLLQTTAVAAKDAPQVRTDNLMGVFKEVHVPGNGEALLSDADKQANHAVFAKLDAFFDYERIADAVIAPSKKSLNAEQLGRFSVSFRELIRLVAFPRSGEFVRQAQLKVGKPKTQGGKVSVEVEGSVPDQDSETTITFQWEDAGAEWRVTDVSFNGVSVVKDYQNQFARVIAKDGPEGFLKKLSTKLEEKRKTHG